jgi:hypothetical protein
MTMKHSFCLRMVPKNWNYLTHSYRGINVKFESFNWLGYRFLRCPVKYVRLAIFNFITLTS